MTDLWKNRKLDSKTDCDGDCNEYQPWLGLVWTPSYLCLVFINHSLSLSLSFSQFLLVTLIISYSASLLSAGLLTLSLSDGTTLDLSKFKLFLLFPYGFTLVFPLSPFPSLLLSLFCHPSYNSHSLSQFLSPFSHSHLYFS